MNEDLDRLIRREFGLGAPEPAGAIHKVRDPRLPQFEFHWHPSTQKVYRCGYPGEWRDGEWVPRDLRIDERPVAPCIAEHCLTHAQFIGFVQTWCRGYLLAIIHARGDPTYGAHLPNVLAERNESCPTDK